MPLISISWDDAMVGQTVPSTIVDPSSGTGAIPSASNSNVNIAGEMSKLTLVVKHARKFGIKGLALRRAPT